MIIEVKFAVESVAEATPFVAQGEGEAVSSDENLVDIETDGRDELPCPADGVIVKIPKGTRR